MKKAFLVLLALFCFSSIAFAPVYTWVYCYHHGDQTKPYRNVRVWFYWLGYGDVWVKMPPTTGVLTPADGKLPFAGEPDEQWKFVTQNGRIKTHGPFTITSHDQVIPLDAGLHYKKSSTSTPLAGTLPYIEKQKQAKSQHSR